MKKILVIENGLGFGGALTSLYSFLQAVSDNELDFHLITSYPQMLIRPGGPVKKVSVIKRNKLYGPSSVLEKKIRKFIGLKAAYLSFFLDFFKSCLPYALKIKQYIKNNDISLVHLNNGILINDAGVLGAFLSGVPSIVHSRGPEFSGLTSRFFSRFPRRFIAVSKYISKTISALGVNENFIDIIPEGLDIENFISTADGINVRQELSLLDTKPIIGMIGCLVAWKGQDIFLKACAKVLESRDCNILIVGDTPDNRPEYRQSLQKLAEHLSIREKIFFLGHRNDIPSIIDACDIIVHASTSPEPFGRVIIEAMALAKPVIATEPGGPSEIIENGEDGFLVPPADPEIIAERLKLLIDQPDIGKRMGNKARQKVLQEYSIENHAKKMLISYSHII